MPILFQIKYGMNDFYIWSEVRRTGGDRGRDVLGGDGGAGVERKQNKWKSQRD